MKADIVLTGDGSAFLRMRGSFANRCATEINRLALHQCFSMKKRFFIVAFIAFAIWFVYGAYRGLTDVEIGESLQSVDWLPDAATNVSYYRSYLNTAYEFDISEREFREWSRWDLTEITKPVQISRYLAFSTTLPEEPSNPTRAEIEALALAIAKRGVTIRDGLYCGYLQGNGGGVWVGYDRDSGRAYYQSAPR
ncbi:hypothetical protein [Planctomycetes bacterium TBK1r]|uniref:hypothetical protein n=1 Tax=Stieleria magnilauensis TaxID=2527963 RepID=UPI0011A5CE1D